ncbi:MAG: tRNA uridine-5-carboxymethylaminomethyl(34) synthesis GTPase MnmE [Rhodospirillales bacterium]|nr:tRNA uridine-5-carboxymethylaminomethyl(34) synthesis GTPase MnmE [Rhodospirillales bacterium]
MALTDTIFALASGHGKAGVAVVRLSGPLAKGTFETFTKIKSPEPRRALYGRIVDPITGEAIDDGLFLYFKSPASFTGEDVVEFQIHGGPSVTSGLISALGKREGLRLAEPGEFTRRAFENGKMDLTAAEGLADLINAETAAQRKQAQRQMSGELGQLYDNWREKLKRVLAHKEAAIDFPEEDLPEEIEVALMEKVSSLREEIESHLADNRKGERLRDGIRLAILGAPNVGKSSLLNKLAQREAAIVSDIAGTTRDIIEVHLDLAGYPVTISDTAGLRSGAGLIEQEGIKRAVHAAEEADLKLVVFDGSIWPQGSEEGWKLVDENSLVVINKCDLSEPILDKVCGQKPHYISAKDDTGLDALLAELGEQVSLRWQVQETPWITRERHREALKECQDHLQRFALSKESELGAEDLRLATRCLGKITGVVDVEELLDVIFRDFCIGK